MRGVDAVEEGQIDKEGLFALRLDEPQSFISEEITLIHAFGALHLRTSLPRAEVALLVRIRNDEAVLKTALRGQILAILAEMPFAENGGGDASFAQRLGHTDFPRRDEFHALRGGDESMRGILRSTALLTTDGVAAGARSVLTKT